MQVADASWRSDHQQNASEQLTAKVERLMSEVSAEVISWSVRCKRREEMSAAVVLKDESMTLHALNR